jgi:hypothetical protein
MAIRWRYETNTGMNVCLGMTSDDNNTGLPLPDEEYDTLSFAWTDPDPIAPDGVDLQPLKRYTIATNTVTLMNAAQLQTWNTRLAKKAKNKLVDRKTQRLFNKGLSYDGAIFPLQVDDSLYYLSLYQTRNSLVSYPFLLVQRNRDTYSVSNANAMKQFGEAAIARQKQIIEEARDIKKLIHDAATVAAVNSITDDRV